MADSENASPQSIHRADQSPQCRSEALASPKSVSSETLSQPPSAGDRIHKFTAEASIVIVGARASGKTTLAIMTASALNKKIIDMETLFHRITSLSSPAFSNEHGTTQCQKRQADMLEKTLEDHPRGSIIVCSWMERRIQRLLRSFATTNPVIHVIRSQEAIRDCLQITSQTKLSEFWRTSNAFFRSCANLEFFNVTESMPPGSDQEGSKVPGSLIPCLALKQTEQHLFKFLSQMYPPGTIRFFESAYPLASVSTEQRKYTHALAVSLEDILLGRIDIEDSAAGADAYELIVDTKVGISEGSSYSEQFSAIANRVTEAIGLVRRISVLPIIVHTILPITFTGTTWCLYRDLLPHILTLVPDMMTVDLRRDDNAISQLTKLTRTTRLIGHREDSHHLSWSDQDWLRDYQRAVRLKCDLVRLIQPAVFIDDNFEAAQLRSTIERLPGPQIPCIVYNSGRMGRHSALLNPVLTSVSPGERNGRTAQLTAQSATQAVYAGFLFDAMKLYVFGANVSYSMSPAMHNAALQVCGIPHWYEPFSTSSIDQVRHLIQDEHFGGASVGLPFKVESIVLTDALSPHAQAIGAINTLIPIRHLNEDGSVPTGAAFFQQVNRAGPVKALYGDNTDWIGIRSCIRRGLSPANAVRPTTCALVIGAGGMARAAIYALLQVGVGSIAIYNRTVENARKLAGHFKSLLKRKQYQGLGAGSNTKFEVVEKLTEPWQSQFRLPSIIISCIPTHPIGDVPSPEFKVPIQWLDNQTGGVIVELGYKNLNTPLLQQAVDNAHRGWVAMDGLDLLPSQGFAQFEFFTGKRAPRRVMRRAVFENYPDHYGRSNAAELRRRLQTMIE